MGETRVAVLLGVSFGGGREGGGAVFFSREIISGERERFCNCCFSFGFKSLLDDKYNSFKCSGNISLFCLFFTFCSVCKFELEILVSIISSTLPMTVPEFISKFSFVGFITLTGKHPSLDLMFTSVCPTNNEFSSDPISFGEIIP